jgi:predicted Zn-dependent protease
MRQSALRSLLAILLIGTSLWAQKANVPLPKPSGFNLFSVEQEIEVGKQNAAEVAKKYPLLPDSNPIAQFVQRLGHQLIDQLPQPTYPFQFHVIREKDINAFALPGGPVYVNLGTIQACSNEAQLAGVMAHEISHVYMRHATKQASKEEMAQVPLGVLGAMLGGGVGGSLAQIGMQITAGSVFLKYSRDAESQADHVGAQIMYDAGYDPFQLALFFAKLDEEAGSRGSQFFSDHPNPGNRSEAIRNEVQQFPKKEFVTNTPEFDQMHQLAMQERSYTAQQIANGQFAHEAPEAGPNGDNGAQPSIGPSGNYRTFKHGAYTVTYPENWQIHGDAESAVTIAPRNGIANDAVAIGAIINEFQPENSAGIDTATHQLVRSLQQSNPALKEIGNDEDVTVNKVHGKSVDMIGKSPLTGSDGQPERERDWLVALPAQDGSVIYVVFIAPDQDFMNLRPTFEQMLRTLHLK